MAATRGNKVDIILSQSLIIGMKQYDNSKHANYKNLETSHNDAIELEKFIETKLNWKKNQIKTITDSNAYINNLHSNLTKEL